MVIGSIEALPSAALSESTAPFAHLTLIGDPQPRALWRVVTCLALVASRDAEDRTTLVTIDQRDGTHAEQAVRLWVAAGALGVPGQLGAVLQYVSRMRAFIARATCQTNAGDDAIALVRRSASRGTVVLGTGVLLHLTQAECCVPSHIRVHARSAA
jgi:hypothetical protein